MLKRKQYDLIVLANHQPSLWAKDMVKEYRKEGDQFTEIRSWLVTNNYSLKELKHQFKFDDLPCLIVTEQIASNRKSKKHYYKDEIEKTIKALTIEEMRIYAKLPKRKQSNSLHLRVHKAEQEYRRDVIPAAEDNENNEYSVSDVLGGKPGGSKKTPTNV